MTSGRFVVQDFVRQPSQDRSTRQHASDGSPLVSGLGCFGMDVAFPRQAKGDLEPPALLISYVDLGAADCKQRGKTMPMYHMLN